MNLYIALFLFLISVLTLIWGYRSGMRHNGRNKQNDAYFVMSLSTCIWSGSLAIMMLCPPEQSAVFAAVSIWGAANFAVQLLLFMLSLYGDTLLYKVMYVLVPLGAMIVWMLRVFGDSYDMGETKYGIFCPRSKKSPHINNFIRNMDKVKKNYLYLIIKFAIIYHE